jgi:UDP-N-acetylmuramate dehydrogenase
VQKVLTVDRAGELREREKRDFEIDYRHCRAPAEEWFVGAWFSLQQGDGERSRGRIRELLARRIATQPLQLPNAGSVFRNPPGDHAARLIESCGLKGLARGGARISDKHANFIVNPESTAMAADIEGLIVEAKKIVLAKTGVDLVPEVRIVGEAA